MNIKPILLVEDDKNDLRLILKGLKEHNLANEIIVTRDGAEALDYIYRRGKYEQYDATQPAVVLLDLKLPKINGLEVLKQIRANPATQFIPVVILTSSSEEQDIVEGYKLGVNAYVVKPIDFTAFVEAVKKLGCFWLLLNESINGAK